MKGLDVLMCLLTVSARFDHLPVVELGTNVQKSGFSKYELVRPIPFERMKYLDVLVCLGQKH